MFSFVSKDLHLCNILEDNDFASYNTRAERLFSATREHNVYNNIAEDSTSCPLPLEYTCMGLCFYKGHSSFLAGQWITLSITSIQEEYARF